MEDLVKNAGDEEQVKAATKKQVGRRERELDDVRFVLSQPAGRRFIWRYLATCDRTSMDNSGSWTAFYEGERNIANKMKADVIDANAEALLQMMKESKGN